MEFDAGNARRRTDRLWLVMTMAALAGCLFGAGQTAVHAFWSAEAQAQLDVEFQAAATDEGRRGL